MQSPELPSGGKDYAAALEASEARFRSLIQQNADGILVVRSSGVICFVNPAAESLLCRKAGELLGEMFGVPVLPGEIAEVDVVCSGERDRVAEMRVTPIDWEGEPAYLAVLHDITQRKRGEEGLRLLSEASAVLVDSLDASAMLANMVRLLVRHLAEWCFLDLLEGDGLINRLVAEHSDETRHESFQQLQGQLALDPRAAYGLPQVLRTGRAAVYPELSDAVLMTLVTNVEHLQTVRACRPRSLMLVPLVARGRTLGVLTLGTGNSPRCYGETDLALADALARRAALALDNARLYEESQSAIRRRDEFLAMLAHELRNPLAPILNAVEILRLHPASDRTLERVYDVINRQGRHMARLLDDLLDVSRVTHNKIMLRPEPVDLVAVLQGAVQTSRPHIDARHHQLTVELGEGPLIVQGDPTRLEQVFVNLLNNAAKYTPSGGHLRLKAAADRHEGVVQVSDDGMGIPAEMLARVFDPFTQLDQSLARSQGGLGIGLSMVKRLVEMHGGSVRAESDGPDRGSRFVVRVPLRLRSRTGESHAGGTGERPTGRRLVLVEDSPDGRAMLEELLRLWGHQVFVAENGPEGIETIRRERPDVAIIDIGLPGADGFTVGQMAREAIPSLFLIALTGYGQQADLQRSRAAGFNLHLVKPVDLEELSRLLRELPVAHAS